MINKYSNKWTPEYALQGLQARIDKIVLEYKKEVFRNHFIDVHPAKKLDWDDFKDFEIVK